MATVSVQEAADRLRCSTQYVCRLLGDGRLEGTREGRTWKVDATSLEELASTRTPGVETGQLPQVSQVVQPQRLPRAVDNAHRQVRPAPRATHLGGGAHHDGTVRDPWERLALVQAENDMLKASVAHLTTALAEVSAAVGPLLSVPGARKP